MRNKLFYFLFFFLDEKGILYNILLLFGGPLTSGGLRQSPKWPIGSAGTVHKYGFGKALTTVIQNIINQECHCSSNEVIVNIISKPPEWTSIGKLIPAYHSINVSRSHGIAYKIRAFSSSLLNAINAIF